MRAQQELNGFRRTGSQVGSNSASGYGYGNNAMYSVSTTGSGEYKGAKGTSYAERSPSGWSGRIDHQYNDPPKAKKQKKHKDKTYSSSTNTSGTSGVKSDMKELGNKIAKVGDWIDSHSKGKGEKARRKKEMQGGIRAEQQRQDEWREEHQQPYCEPLYSSQPSFCAHCGAGLVAGAKFCAGCGATV